MKIFLIILAVILLLIGIMLVIKYKAIINGANADVSVYIGVFTLKLKVFPLAKRTKKSKPKKVESKEPEEKPPSKFSLKNIDIMETVQIVVDLLSQFNNSFIIENIDINANVSTGDAAKTAILTGKLWAAAGIIMPAIEKNYIVKKQNVYITPNFENDKSNTDYLLCISVRPIKLILVVLRNFKTINALVKSFKKEENEI